MQTTQLGTVQQYKSDVAFKTLVEGVNDNSDGKKSRFRSWHVP